jgi:hypothetical protein
MCAALSNYACENLWQDPHPLFCAEIQIKEEINDIALPGENASASCPI